MTDYPQQWARFRRLRNTWLALLVLEFSPFARWLYPLLRRLLPSASTASLIVGPEFLCLVGLAFLGRDLAKWKCPRCSKFFAGGRKVMDSVKTCLDWLILPKKCVSCGLPKYATDAHVDPQAPQGPMRADSAR
jgi:hypothetical protein